MLGATSKRIRVGRLALFGAIVATPLFAYFFFDLGQYVSLEFLKANRAAIDSYFQAHPLRTAAMFFLLYCGVTSLSIPGTLLLTVSAGAIFGLVWGTLLVSFSSALGATIAFLSSRFLFHDWVERRFGKQLAVFKRGVERDGAFYVVSLGLIPIFPYSVINLVMGLTPMRFTTFYLSSQAGMLIETMF